MRFGISIPAFADFSNPRALAELVHDAPQIKNPLSRAFRQYKYLLFVDLLLIYRLFHRFIKRTFQFGHFPRFPQPTHSI